MNNTNQQLYAIYRNLQSFYRYRRLVPLGDEYSQEQFIKQIQKDKYMILSAADQAEVSDADGNLDKDKLGLIKQSILDYNEKSKTQLFTLTSILLVYPGTDCESKRANMMRLINHIRYPRVNIIIVTPTKVTSGVLKGLVALTSQKEHRYHDFKAFTYTLLNSVLPEHELAPRYEILATEKIDQLKEWFIDPDSLPKVFESDPQMVWLGAVAGDVIKFVYLSEVTIEAIGYCKVVPSVQ